VPGGSKNHRQSKKNGQEHDEKTDSALCTAKTRAFFRSLFKRA
jgi:hypothetical protein